MAVEKKLRKLQGIFFLLLYGHPVLSLIFKPSIFMFPRYLQYLLTDFR